MFWLLSDSSCLYMMFSMSALLLSYCCVFHRNAFTQTQPDAHLFPVSEFMGRQVTEPRRYSVFVCMCLRVWKHCLLLICTHWCPATLRRTFPPEKLFQRLICIYRRVTWLDGLCCGVIRAPHSNFGWTGARGEGVLEMDPGAGQADGGSKRAEW